MSTAQTPPSTQKALILESFSTPLKISTSHPVPRATPGSAIVRVLASAVPPYMSEILTGSRPYPLPLPLVPGPGAIGRVHEVGPDATRTKVGQLVWVDLFVEARDAPSSSFLQGIHSGYSPMTQRLAADVWRDGGFAEFAYAPLENIQPIDESLLAKPGQEGGYAPAELMWLFALLIPYGGFADANIKAGDTVIIAPATGFFGRAAIAVSLAVGARVVAAGRNADALSKLAPSFGVSNSRLLTVQLTGDVDTDTAALRAASGSDGADIFQDWCPPSAGFDANGNEHSPPHIAACIAALRPGGAASLMGGIRGEIKIPYGLVMHRNIRILGRFMYAREHIEQLFKMVERGVLKLGEGAGLPVAQTFPLEEFEEALKFAKDDFGKSGLVVFTL